MNVVTDIDAATLRRLYVDERKSTREIAAMIGRSARHVSDLLVRFDIPARTAGGTNHSQDLTEAPGKKRKGRHGYHALRRRIALVGVGAIDKRTAGGRFLAKWMEEAVLHLGGASEVSHFERTLIEHMGLGEVLLRSMEHEIGKTGLMVGGEPHPLLADYRGLRRDAAPRARCQR